MKAHSFAAVTLLSLSSILNEASGFSVSQKDVNRRNFFTTASIPLITAVIPLEAKASTTSDNLTADLKVAREKLTPIPDLLDKADWDAVRTILKTPPVNQLWNLGESKNTLMQLAKETGNFDLIEIKDELAGSLQMCDQFTYDNVFIYFQPGNGKVKVKEPKDLAMRAMKQLDEAITMASE